MWNRETAKASSVVSDQSQSDDISGAEQSAAVQPSPEVQSDAPRNARPALKKRHAYLPLDDESEAPPNTAAHLIQKQVCNHLLFQYFDHCAY